MVGMSVTLGGQRRVFGRSDTDATTSCEEIRSEARQILGRDWINGLILHIPTERLSVIQHYQPAVKGVTVSFSANSAELWHNPHSTHSND